MSTTFRVGDRVRVPLARGSLTGTIVEDRGAIGVRGRRLYQVLVAMDPFEPAPYEVPEDELEAIEANAESDLPAEMPRFLDYLKKGGLISILRSGISGGRNQPRVWLTLDSLGNVTHTFNKERGLLGGEPVPIRAVHEDKVFTPKTDEVLSYLKSFGLNRKEAEDVLTSVGTASV